MTKPAAPASATAESPGAAAPAATAAIAASVPAVDAAIDTADAQPARWRLVAQRYGRGVLLIAVLIGAIVWLGPRVLRGPEVALLQVVQQDFVQSVVASGRVESPHRVSVGAQITGTVARVPVDEGQQVDVDTILIELDASELQAVVTQAQASVALARAQLRQLQEVQAPVAALTLQEAEANQRAALRILQRQQELKADSMISQSVLDEALRAEQVTRSKVSSFRQQLLSTGAQGSQAELAAVTLQQAQASLQLALARLAYTRLTAPVAGVLISRQVEPGSVVQPGLVLMQLAPSTSTQLVVQIEEKNLHLLQLGQRALVSADAYADASFPATLTYINPGIDAGRGVVEVKLAVATPPAYLRQDMTVSVDIVVASRLQAVLVPAGAVHDNDPRAPWVLLLDGWRVRRQDVQLGLRSRGWSEVLSGLQPGDWLVPVSNGQIQPGQRIRQLPAVAGVSK
jgi:HlyD family secretion protein